MQDELEARNEQIYNIFLRWYSIPETAREADTKTIDEFCTKMGVEKSLIATFQKRPEFTEDLYKAAIAWGKSKVPELLHILYEKYKTSKNPTDLRMYKELINGGDDAKKKDEDSSHSGVLRELFKQTS